MQWLGNLFSWIGLVQSDNVNKNEQDEDINMSDDTENSVEATENKDIEYMTYKPGDVVYYKDIACKVIEIHHAVYPPRATINQIIDGKEINTEFTSLISEKEFMESQNDSFTKHIVNNEESESLLAIPNNNNESDIENENNNENSGANEESKPKSNSKKKSKCVKIKTKSKKKSVSKKKKHIAQIQRPPKKSKRRQKTVQRKNSKKKSRSAKTNARSAKRSLKKKTKKKQLASKTVKIIKGSKSVSKTPTKRNLKKRRLTEIGIENNKSNKTDKKNKIKKLKSPPKKRRRMTEPIDNTEKLVERIYGERIHNGNIEYLMKWKGYKKDESTWAQNDGSDVCRQAIEQFKADLENVEKSKYMKRVVREINSKCKKKRN